MCYQSEVEDAGCRHRRCYRSLEVSVMHRSIDAKQCGALIQYGQSHNSNFLSLLIELIVVVIW